MTHQKKESHASKALNEIESKQLLNNYGIPVIPEKKAADAAGAIAAAESFGYPVVVKGLGKALTHKSDLGIVHLNLNSPGAVEKAAASIAEKAGEALEGFLVQPQFTGKREFLAGIFRDPLFGPVILFGLGGVFAEALADTAFRLAPLTENDARDMLGEIKAKSLLDDFRGEKTADTKAIIQTLMGLSRLAMEREDIAEIDINPLMVSPEGNVCAVDALVVCREAALSEEMLPAVDPDKLKAFFHPRSVAFIGASGQLGKWGHMLTMITIAREYEGGIHMVNPKGGEIAGQPVHKTLDDIPGPVDLAVVTIPAAGVAGLIPRLKAKGVSNMLLITSGFSETGEEGKKEEKALVEKARRAGILVLGPNTMGICNPHIRFYCTGSHVWPEAGDTGVVAQSGNMGTQLLAFAEAQGIGIRCFAGSGNEAMITIEDYIDAFEKDEAVRNIMLYIESVKNGRRFFSSARRISRTKPIVLMKGGRTEAGSLAAASHTGAMASDTRIFNAMCDQAGIVRAGHSTELLDLSAAFSALPLPEGKRVAIMTYGGGWGVVTADLCAEYNLKVPELPDRLIKRIDKLLPPYWSRSNPVDIVGNNEEAVAVSILEELIKWDGCDAVINLGIIGRRNLFGRLADSTLKADPSADSEFLEALKASFIAFEKKYIAYVAELMETHQKPVVGVSISFNQEEQTVHPVDGRKYKGVFYPTPERAVKSLSKMVEYRRFLADADGIRGE